MELAQHRAPLAFISTTLMRAQASVGRVDSAATLARARATLARNVRMASTSLPESVMSRAQWELVVTASRNLPSLVILFLTLDLQALCSYKKYSPL